MIRSEVRGGSVPVTVFVCDECRHWAHVGETIRHAKRCDSSQEQPPSKPATSASTEKNWPAIRHAAKEGAISAVLSEDEIVDAVKKGLISVNDAMNRDF